MRDRQLMADHQRLDQLPEDLDRVRARLAATLTSYIADRNHPVSRLPGEIQAGAALLLQIH